MCIAAQYVTVTLKNSLAGVFFEIFTYLSYKINVLYSFSTEYSMPPDIYWISSIRSRILASRFFDYMYDFFKPTIIRNFRTKILGTVPPINTY